ncbi:hypothetical protein TRM7557_03097 [Tritonibacter multivorans]|uniref:Uncharacterized protein n=1 Tax=Tritonibacter multivorans TaxID=928856 RepID=A0A0P1GGT2_9RHOB|nr:hypothetical protein TRM7557_03097 [Tritonibacter multivorans]
MEIAFAHGLENPIRVHLADRGGRAGDENGLRR